MEYFREHVSDTDMSCFWMDAEPISPYQLVKELSAKDTFYYLCLHGYDHNMLSLYTLSVFSLLRCCSAEMRLPASSLHRQREMETMPKY